MDSDKALFGNRYKNFAYSELVGRKMRHLYNCSCMYKKMNIIYSTRGAHEAESECSNSDPPNLLDNSSVGMWRIYANCERAMCAIFDMHCSFAF